MLVAQLDRQRIRAKTANKGPVYHCPRCRAEVILHKGRIRIHHFAHKPDQACGHCSMETPAHRKAKEVFFELLLNRGFPVEMEYPLSISGQKRCPDIFSKLDNQRIAIEFQRSNIDLDEIEKRTRFHTSNDIAIAWIVIRQINKDKVYTTHGEIVIPQYSARPFERWIHGFNFSQIWFYDPDINKVWEGELKEHMLYVPEREYRDENGYETISGGYERPSKRWRTLLLKGPYDLNTLSFQDKYRKSAKKGNHNYPSGKRLHISVDKS